MYESNLLPAARFTKTAQHVFLKTNPMHVQQKELLYQNPGAGANRLTAALLFVYLMVLGWVLVLKLGTRFSYMRSRRVSLVPFREYLVYHSRMDMSQIVLNILIFVPLGVYTGMLFPQWKPGAKIFFFFLVSFAVEMAQYILAIGAFDSTDIITNTTGGILGYILFTVVERMRNSHLAAQRTINFIALAGTACMVLLLVLLKLDMLPVRYR